MCNWFESSFKTGVAIVFCAGALWIAPTVHADPPDGKLRIIVFGAHPDDPEIGAGGVTALWTKAGHHVKMVSVANGDAGHWSMTPEALAKRRAVEVREADKILGAESQVLDIRDGQVMPTLENREKMIRQIRDWKADVVIGHRPNDYHPDHRYVGVLMQDSAFIVTVPMVCPDSPALKRNPLFLYRYDGFTRPNRFSPDVVVSIDPVMDQKLEALLKIESQFIEGGCGGSEKLIPKTDAERATRQEGVRAWFQQRSAAIADQYRDRLIETYGPEEGRNVRYAEAFEICEYGRRLSADANAVCEIFPFLPKKPNN